MELERWAVNYYTQFWQFEIKFCTGKNMKGEMYYEWEERERERESEKYVME